MGIRTVPWRTERLQRNGQRPQVGLRHPLPGVAVSDEADQPAAHLAGLGPLNKAAHRKWTEIQMVRGFQLLYKKLTFSITLLLEIPPLHSKYVATFLVGE